MDAGRFRTQCLSCRHPGLLCTVVLGLIVCGQLPKLAAQQPLKTDVLLTGLRSMYAPVVLDHAGVKRMWLGGWLTDSDPTEFLQHVSRGDDLTQVVGADKIFASELVNGTWTAPVLAFAKGGFHVNDPSVIAPPSSDGIDRSRWLYMYYTALDNRIAAGNPSEWSKNHAIGFASSIDGGKTWTDHGIVVSPWQSGDGMGAWAPSAIVIGNEILVYYHSGTPDFSQPINFRVRFHLTGWQQLGGPERLTFAVPETPTVLVSNVDISRQGALLVMLANTLDLRNIVRYVSQDGLSWVRHPMDTNPIIFGGPNLVLTPHAELLADDRYRLYFGFDTGAGSASVHAWEMLMPPEQANGAQFIAQGVPTAMTAGQSSSVSITMRNIGTTTWSKAAVNRLGSQNPQDNLT